MLDGSKFKKTYTMLDSVSVPDLSDVMYDTVVISQYDDGNYSIEINTKDLKNPLMVTIDSPLLSDFPNTVHIDTKRIQLRYCNKITMELVKLKIISGIVDVRDSKGRRIPIYELTNDFINSAKEFDILSSKGNLSEKKDILINLYKSLNEEINNLFNEVNKLGDENNVLSDYYIDSFDDDFYDPSLASNLIDSMDRTSDKLSELIEKQKRRNEIISEAKKLGVDIESYQ